MSGLICSQAGVKSDAVVVGNQLVRQWLVFPTYAHCKTSITRLLTFRLLIEMSSGHLLFVEIKSRTAITSDVVSLIAASIESLNPYASSSRIVPKLDELGFQPKLLGDPIDDVEAGWFTQTLLAEAVLVNFMARSQQGEILSTGSRPAFVESIKSDLRLALPSFISALQAPVVETILITGNKLTPAAYSYLVGSSAVVRRNRMQSVKAFPLLLCSLINDEGLKTIHHAIDKEAKLVELLASVYKVPIPVVRLLRGMHCELVGLQWVGRLGVLLRLLACLPSHHRPHNPEEWCAFNCAVDTISESFALPISSTRSKIWLHAYAKSKYQLKDMPAFEQAVLDAGEMHGALVSAISFVLRKESGNEQAAYAAVDEFMANIGVFCFAKLLERFVAQYAIELANFVDEAAMLSGTKWMTVLADPFIAPERVVHCLTSAIQLKDEGEELRHCVGSYFISCMYGSAQIWSFRDTAGERCSTLQTFIERRKNGRVVVEIVEHRGKKNSKPSIECLTAANLLLRYLNSQNQAALSNYLAWKKAGASLSVAEREAQILMRPHLAAIEACLPKQWPISRMVSIARGKARI